MTDLNKYIGIPFKDKGRDFDGCDCWGLVDLFHRIELKITLPDYLQTYTTSVDKDSVAHAIYQGQKLWAKINPGQERKGDVVKFAVAGTEWHVGLWLPEASFLHILDGRNSTIESLNSLSWIGRIRGVYRWTESC